jgi:hypothetical protein
MAVKSQDQVEGVIVEQVFGTVDTTTGTIATPTSNLTRMTDIVTVEHYRGGSPLP